MKYSKSQLSWISYDFANSAFHLLIPTILFPLFFKTVLYNDDNSDFMWSLIVSIPIVLVGIIAPFIGAKMDVSERKKQYFVFFTVLAIALNFILGIIPISNHWLLIGTFSFSLLAFNFSQFSYNSFLPSQKKGKGVAKMSGLGWGLGYLGGILCMIPVYLIISGKELPNDYSAYQNAFLVVALFYLLFSIPSLIYLKDTTEKLNLIDKVSPIKQVFKSFKKWKDNKQIFIFLIALYLINDGLSTLVYFTSIFASTTLGLTSKEILNAFLFLQIVAVPATIIFTIISEKIGYIKMLILTVIFWILIGISFLAVNSVTQFYILALFVGLVIGTTPALGRAILSKYLENRKDASEFFGFHTFASRTSAVVGPLLFGVISAATGNQKIALSSLSVFFFLGLILLWKIRKFDFKTNEIE